MPDIQVKKTGEEPGAASLAVTVPLEHVREAEERATTVYRQRERLGKFHLKRRVAKVTEEQVLAQLNELREQKAPWTPVPGERPQLKDLVHVTIATREGEGAEAKEPQPYQLVLGEGRAIPEVE